MATRPPKPRAAPEVKTIRRKIRLLADAGALAGQSPVAITAALLQKVRAFADRAPQSDDIAILALRVGVSAPGKDGPA